MKDPQTIRSVLHCFRAFGFYPFDVQMDSSTSLHLKMNSRWYIYATIVAVVNFINVVDVTVKPHWDISNFHGLVTYIRLILVSFDALICCTETLYNVRRHVDFFETIARLDVVLEKFNVKVSCKRLRLWVRSFRSGTNDVKGSNSTIIYRIEIFRFFLFAMLSAFYTLKSFFLGTSVCIPASHSKRHTTILLYLRHVPHNPNN